MKSRYHPDNIPVNREIGNAVLKGEEIGIIGIKSRTSDPSLLSGMELGYNL